MLSADEVNKKLFKEVIKEKCDDWLSTLQGNILENASKHKYKICDYKRYITIRERVPLTLDFWELFFAIGETVLDYDEGFKQGDFAKAGEYIYDVLYDGKYDVKSVFIKKTAVFDKEDDASLHDGRSVKIGDYEYFEIYVHW